MNERNEIAIFENDIVRLALADRECEKCDYQLLDEIIYMVINHINHNEILWQILRDGIKIGDKEYMLFTATTGQVRNVTVTLMRKDFFEKHKGFLMVGLTTESINANGGMNVGKYLSYNALSLSSSVKPQTVIDIDRCIVVEGLETVVTDKVKYIDIRTDDNGQCYVNDTPKEYQTKSISIEHTDGAGMFIPGELPSSCQIRGGYIKGAMFPFDFRLFTHEVSHNSILIDPWGTPHDVEEEDIRYIITISQLKMWKQYESWEHYKAKFKENNLELSINSYANPPKEEVTFSYQFLQTLPYNTDITELCKPAIEDLTKLKTDFDYMKSQLGLTLDEVTDDDTDEEIKEQKSQTVDTNVERANYYIAKALDIYPPLIHDKHIMNKVQSLFKAKKRAYMGGKLPMRGYYSYVAPDMYAFCEYLFMGNTNPQGLVPENYVYNKYYSGCEDVEEVLCLRSPHLSRYEYPRRKLISSDECNKWFGYMESDTVVSCHDLISKSLQCDWDGDEILVCPDKALLKAAESLPQEPLYYDMQKAEPQQITNEAIYDTLVKGFSNNIIGESSNAITKLWNVPELADNPLMYDDMINVICALSNYAIDFPKTGKNLDIGEYQKLYKDLVPPEDIREKFKPQKIKYPQFFKYAKGKKSNLAEYTDSPMDRIAQYIDKTAGSKHYKYEIGTDEEFDYRQLMNNSVGKNSKPLFEVDRSDERYMKAYNVLNSRKKAKQKLCQDIKKEIDRKNTDTKEITAKYDVFHYYCIKEIKDIFTDKKGIFNVNLAVNYIIDMEYNKGDFYTTSKDILWKCFGNVIVDNLNRNQKTGITLKERPRMCYKKAVRGNDELDQMITDRMERKSVDITQTDMNYMGAVLQTKKNGSYYQNDVGLLFALLCHYKYAKQSGRLKEDGSFYITRKKHKTIIKPNGKKKKVDIFYNMNKIMEMVGAKSYAGSFTRFMDSGIQIETDENKISIKLDIEEEDNTEVLFTVQDIYNPMIYLQAYNEDKELSECVVCGKHFIKDRNKKTCSNKCKDKYHKICVDRNNDKNKSATIADKKAI
uniref:RNA dependent RNA polymerase n=1 Tax=Lachnospira eligens TaxID=39485 RepID=UPI003FEFF3E2